MNYLYLRLLKISSVCRYHASFQSIKTKKKQGAQSSIERVHDIGRMNTIVIDIIKAIWSGQMYKQGEKSMFFLRHHSKTCPSLPEVGNGLVLYLHPGLMAYVLKFLKEVWFVWSSTFFPLVSFCCQYFSITRCPYICIDSRYKGLA